MATCAFENCNRKAFRDGLCVDHMPKPKKAADPVCTVYLARPAGQTTPPPAFLALSRSATPAHPYKQRIEHLRQSGPVWGSPELVHDVECLHDTQPSNNVTVWYSWDRNQNVMTVWGLGSHSGGSGAGNDSYQMLWFDGTNKTWIRPRKKPRKKK
jgi:hypothetical protein